MTKAKSKKPTPEQDRPIQPWIKLRTGLGVIGALSLIFGAFLAYQVWPATDWKEALLWGLGGAAAVWLAFGVSLLINIITRGTGFLRSEAETENKHGQR